MKKLKRSRSDSIISGTCGGLAEYTGVPVGAFRILFIILVFVGVPYIVFAYLLSYFIIPLDDKEESLDNLDTHLNKYDNLDSEFDVLDKSLSRLENKLARLEDKAIRRNSF